ncbi:MAG: non-canonical purine NTP pyrophosphatase [Methanoculleus sp.]|jgi:XTP/dITP diphosphohydrolase|nr:non-canonical purine NTP pyrophosphatase [Candidatus Moranbacteria bacterium]
MKKILIATTNKNKADQFKRIFKREKFYLKTTFLVEMGIKDDIEEDGKTLLENAEKKAEYFGEKTGLLTLADDFGFFVYHMGGKPGIHAKRWMEGTDTDRCDEILKRLDGLLEKDRGALYAGVIAVYDPKVKKFWHFKLETRGKVSNKFKGKKAFGYDQIFSPDKFPDKTYSELSDEELEAVEHRSKGVMEFLKIYGKKL